MADPLICAYVHCDRRLSPGNYAGVCQNHVHTHACRCDACARIAAGMSWRKQPEGPAPVFTRQSATIAGCKVVARGRHAAVTIEAMAFYVGRKRALRRRLLNG